MTRHARSKVEWSQLRLQYLADLATKHGIRLTLRDRVWGVTHTDHWVALPGVTATNNPDQWWLGYMRDEFRQRRAAGAILLCASVDRPLLDFGLPAALISEIEPNLSLGNGRAQLYFNVFRRKGRFELQLKGGRSLDITQRLGDLSWLRSLTAVPSACPTPRDDAKRAPEQPPARSAVAEANASYGDGSDGPARGNCRFFARYTSEGLRPLDPVDLRAEAVYLVEARPVDAAPRSAALRRIVARGGPGGLPHDLAQQHDHYAHGAPRR